MLYVSAGSLSDDRQLGLLRLVTRVSVGPVTVHQVALTKWLCDTLSHHPIIATENLHDQV